jgi:hypothetical protein
VGRELRVMGTVGSALVMTSEIATLLLVSCLLMMVVLAESLSSTWQVERSAQHVFHAGVAAHT